MDAREYFNYVVVPKYKEFVKSPNDFLLLESALYSMDTVAERLGLHQLGYAQVSREALYEEAKKIRGQSTSLKNLHCCSNALKHGPSIRDHSAASSEQLQHPLALIPTTQPHGRSAGMIL